MVEPSEPGVRRCMKCGWFFVSPDPKRIGRCADCKSHEESYQPKSACVSQVYHAVRFHLKGIT